MTNDRPALRQLLEHAVGADEVTRVEYFPTLQQLALRWLRASQAGETIVDIEDALYLAAMLDQVGLPDEAKQVTEVVAARSNSAAEVALALNWQGVLAASRGHYEQASAALQPLVPGADDDSPGRWNPDGTGYSTAFGLACINLVVIYLQTGQYEAARELVDRIHAEGIGTDDPRGDILLNIVEVQLERATGTATSVAEAVAQLRSVISGALTDPDLAGVDDLELLSHLALAEFDQAKADRSRTAMLDAADAAVLTTQMLTATVGLQDRTAIILRTHAALSDFEAACESRDSDTAGAAILTLEACYQNVCTVFGVRDRRAITLQANIAVAKLEHARMLRSASAARNAVEELHAVDHAALAVFEPTHPTAVTIAANLASAALDLARVEDSEPAMRLAAELLESSAVRSRQLFGELHPVSQIAMRELSLCLAWLDDDDRRGGGATLTMRRTMQAAPEPGFDHEYVSTEEAARILGQAGAASSPRGRRIVGTERQTLAKDLVRRYNSGESIRALAASTGRSYGFIHRVLTESGVQLRQRGGARRRKKA